MDVRDGIVDFVKSLHKLTGISQLRLLGWLKLSRSKYYDWQQRYGKANEHNGLIPRDWWLEKWEKEAIIAYFIDHPFDGYRRLSYMMLDEGVVAVSPATTYRVLRDADLLGHRQVKPSLKGTGFIQPLKAHQHWHIDITYLNLGGTFYYLCSILDGFSRTILHWDIGESMKESDVQIILQQAREKYPGATPRIISDNGPQFVAKDFKEFVRLCGMTHVRTSPYYPQSNGKLERAQGLLKQECIRQKCPQTLKQAYKVVTEYVRYYNQKRLHSAIGYITPIDMLNGRQKEIHDKREQRLIQAREQRKEKRQRLYSNKQIQAS
jgi:transposase InsO family protein